MPNDIKNKLAKERILNTAKQSEKFNADHKLQSFNAGEKVLFKSLYVSQSIDNKAAKFFRLYNGLFRLAEEVEKHTFIIVNSNNNKILGNFMHHH